jgi:hypothetical protein
MRGIGLATAATVGGAKDSAEKGLEAWQTPSDDGDIAFNDRPYGEVARVP